MPFYDRKEAGQRLAQKLKPQKLKPKNSIILALPRGGVIVAKEVAKVLKIPLDIIVVRKIGYPQNPEYAIGAVGESGKAVLGKEELGISKEYIEEQIKKERQEIERRLREYRGERETPDLKDKTVLLIDDGLATGLSMKAAVKEVEVKNPDKVIVAVPVAPPETVEELKKEADLPRGKAGKIICLETPSPFFAIGNFYTNFPQITDQEVKEALED